ncbi:hypothetical protein SPRG_12882 [Saprolegnia parasitica CBS 223.65]|uniref:Band 7 domain-containing protein n=1 Tax=Saprolegnia parasitica (strain CBS 223.65) TaxID=695850 RepID=A0A067C522_SAPPC|nr:hypothetical protein SPRG_12882 [Saprolegnia parasitica CBS 223.65]KDO21641.1 hypothetical protein SPRG_12882 [Saprolegnia parasitica CBS 223.65]|eukprot:XP_012207653.1 hypothetical protein SPRG_12882 [Saprolegnia parasitica CBS 223.65]
MSATKTSNANNKSNTPSTGRQPSMREPIEFTWKEASALAALGVVGFGVWLGTCRFHVCPPNRYLVRTGLGIKDMAVSRMGLQWPFQEAITVPMNPSSFRFNLACLSKQYLPFEMPVAYTVAPANPIEDPSGFKRYVERMQQLPPDEFEETLLGIIHGETRVQAALMDIDAINDDREAFRTNVVALVQRQLNQLGLEIINANIAELREAKRANGQMGYLEARERKKLANTLQDAEIDVADANKRGDIEQKIRQRDTRIAVANMEKEAQITENEQQAAIANSKATLAIIEGEASRKIEVAKIEAEQMAEVRLQQLRLNVEQLRQEQLLVAKKADILTSAQVEADALREQANARLYAAERDAEAALAMMEAEGRGLKAKMIMESEGLAAIVAAAGHDADLAKQYLYIRAEVPQQLAESQAKALQGLQPKVWAFNNGSDASAPSMVNDFLKGFGPAMDILQESGIVGNKRTSALEVDAITAKFAPK